MALELSQSGRKVSNHYNSGSLTTKEIYSLKTYNYKTAQEKTIRVIFTKLMKWQFENSYQRILIPNVLGVNSTI